MINKNKILLFFRNIVAAALLVGFMLLFWGCEDKGSSDVWENAGDEMIKGQRRAAEDSKELLKVKPGARVMEHEPFFSSVWKAKHVPLPDSMEELSSKIESGSCDYVVVDNLSVRRRSPRLKPLLTGTKPLAGTGLVYRRYLKDPEKLFSIYKRGGAPLETNSGLSKKSSPQDIQKALKLARQYYLEGYLEHSHRLLLDVIEVAPRNAIAHRELVKVYIIYGNFDGKSLEKAQDHLLRYSFLSPGQKITSYQETIQRISTQHKARWGTE